MSSKTFSYRQLTLIVKYNVVIFPFDIFLFLNALPSLGFVLTDPDTPISVKSEISPFPARKGDIAVRIDPNRKLFGIHATNVESVLEEMDKLESWLNEKFQVDGSKLAEYYETIASLTVKATKNPLECWSTHLKQDPILTKFSDILGTEVAPFGLRLSPKGEGPNQTNWFEIRVEPDVEMAANHHHVSVIYRRSNKEEVISFVAKLDEVIGNFIELVEQG